MNAGTEARAAWALGIAERVRERDFSSLPEAELRRRLRTAAARALDGSEDALADALGVVAGRVSYAPTAQQLAAAALLLDGVIVEMDAGEGKTLASVMAAVVFAAAGRRVHILTANDYLAARDRDNHASAMESLGIAHGLVVESVDASERLPQYARPVVFTTAREVGFDWLRDNIAVSVEARVRPAFDVAIVDEADHQLVDQARTPLIISGASDDGETQAGEDDPVERLASLMIEEQAARLDGLYSALDGGEADVERALATILLGEGLSQRLLSALERHGKSPRRIREELLRLNDDEDGRPLESGLLFGIDAANSALTPTEDGWDFVVGGLERPSEAFEVVQTMGARVINASGEDYVVGEDGVTLVDRLDGRPMSGHRYMDGLHEAIERKEGVETRARANPSAQTTMRALMSNYATISGLTGTAVEATVALAQDYGAATVRIPATFESRRADLGARVFFDRDAHVGAVCDEVVRWNGVGRPVLLSVGSVRESETFSAALQKYGVGHRVLNASNPERERDIVARAGEFGAVTVATGMAGRGTDIIVTGDVDRRVAENRLLPVTRGDEGLGLIVIIASLPASRRVERQIRGRTARQGRPGACAARLYANDPTLAFTRQQAALNDMAKRGGEYVEGVEVERLLGEAQGELESGYRRATEASAEFAAVIESESRAHYADRETLMRPGSVRGRLAEDMARWIERRTAPLREFQSDYGAAFDSVAESLWEEYGLDLGAKYALSPSEVTDTLGRLVEGRLFALRSKLGARRFEAEASRAYLESLDSLWPDHLATLQDMALSIAMGASSRSAAIAQFAEEARAFRSKLRSAAADGVIADMLDSERSETPPDSGEDGIVRLPSQLSRLI